MGDDPHLGQTIGKVRIERRIGQGIAGAVYLGEHVTLQKPMAVRILPISPATDAEEIERFLDQARTAARLVHPTIVQVLDVDRTEGYYYLVGQHVDGRTLAEVLATEGRLDWREALRIGRAVAAGLEVAQGEEILHRDVRPGNVMIAADDSIKVLDFGLARPIACEADAAALEPGGPISYLAPEHLSGGPIDHRSDLYSLGATLFHALTGQPPFVGQTASEIVEQHLHRTPPPPSSLVDGLPATVDRLVLSLLEKAPDDRMPDARTLIDSIDHLLAHAGPPAPAPAPAIGSPEEEEEEEADGKRLFVGQLALEKGWIDQAQLDEALAVQDQTRPTMPLGRVLLRLGYLKASQLRALLKGQGLEMEMPTTRTGIRVRDQIFGRLVSLLGLAEQNQVNQALKIQAARLQANRQERLGDILIEQGVLSADQVVEVLAYQRKTVFRCQACERFFNRKDHQAGETVACPHCGCENALPDPASLEATSHMDELEIRLRRLARERRALESEEKTAAHVAEMEDLDADLDESGLPEIEEPATAERPPELGPFLASEMPRRQATDLIEQALDGEAPLGVVIGERGVGKTRFGLEIPRLVGAHRFLHLRPNVPAPSGRPFDAFVPVVEALAEALEGRDASAVAASAPTWAPALLSLVPAQAGRSWARGIERAEGADAVAVAESLLGFLLAVAPVLPFTVYLDDADRLPPQIWRVVSELIRRAEGDLAVFVAIDEASRGDLPVLDALAAEGLLIEIRLKAIPESLVKNLIQHVLGPPPVAEGLAREVHFITSGIGSDVVEFLETGRREGFVFTEDGCWSTDLDRRDRYVEDLLPERIEERLVETAASLPQGHRTLLGQLALMPGPVSTGHLNLVSSLNAGQLNVVLSDLVERRLLVKRARGRVAIFTLTSSRLRRSLGAQIDEKVARALHDKMARHLEKEKDEGKPIPAAILARHFEGAGIADRALDYLTSAGQEALEAGRIAEAVDLLERAQKGQGGDPRAPETARRKRRGFLGGLLKKDVDLSRVPRLLGEAYLRRGEYERARMAFERALAESSPKAPEHAVIQRGLGTSLMKLGHYAEAERNLVASTAGRAADPGLDCQMGQLHLDRDRYDEARQVLERALATLGEAGPADLRTTARHELGRCHFLAGRWSEAEACWTREREILHQETLDAFMPRNLVAVARLRFRRGAILGALELLERARIFATRHHNKEVEPSIHQAFGAIQLVRENYPRAIQEFQVGLEKAQALGQPERTGRLVQGIARVLVAIGKFPEAIDACGKAQQVFEELQFRRGLGENYHLRGDISLRAGEGEMAAQYFEYARREIAAIGAAWRLPPLYLSFSRQARAAGNLEEAERYLAEAAEIARAHDDRTNVSAVLRLRAEVSQTSGDAAGSEEFLRRAQAALKES